MSTCNTVAQCGEAFVMSDILTSGTDFFQSEAKPEAMSGYSAYTYPHPDIDEAVVPTVVNITSSTANGTYVASNQINITVYFSELVTSTGNITINLDSGQAVTATATAKAMATATYTVQDGDSSADLTVSSITGTVNDLATTPNAVADFTPTTNLAANKAIVIDTDVAHGSVDGAPAQIDSTAPVAVIGAW